MTIFFRNLSDFKKDEPFNGLKAVEDSFYMPKEVSGAIEEKWNDWFQRYATRLEQEPFSDEERKEKMNTVNPKYVLRNYMAQLAIDAADKGNYKLIDELFLLLKQ